MIESKSTSFSAIAVSGCSCVRVGSKGGPRAGGVEEGARRSVFTPSNELVSTGSVVLLGC